MALLAVLAVGGALVLLALVLYQRRQIAELKAQLSETVRSDQLTGLLNLGTFEELIDQELERSKRTGHPMSVLVGDVDWLELVNARYGQRTGDAVLQSIARDLHKWKRRIDSAARLGDEEFGLLLPETDEGGAFVVAERLRRAAHQTLANSNEPMAVTISLGVASYPGHGDERDVLLACASSAMAAAKEMGKDRSVIYSPEVASVLADGAGPERAELQLATVIALAEALDIRDSGTTEHSRMVGRLCQLTAAELGLSAERVERVRLAGVLHDVGKIGVPDRMLSNPGLLAPDDWKQMRDHPKTGARLLAHGDLDDLRSWILAHHERPDGLGYPAGSAGEEIPLEARIVAVADAYEAMTADRAYRPALGAEAARAELEAGAGSQFDARVVKALISALSGEGASLPRAS